MASSTSESVRRAFVAPAERSVRKSAGSGTHRGLLTLRGSALCKLLALGGDVLALAVVPAGIAIWDEVHPFSVAFTSRPALLLSILASGALGINWLFGTYRIAEIRRPEKELERVVKALGSFFLLVCAGALLLFGNRPQLDIDILLSTGLALALVLVARGIVRLIVTAAWKKGLARQAAIFIGSPSALANFLESLAVQRYRGIDVRASISPGVAQADQASGSEESMAFLDKKDWRTIFEQLDPECVVVNIDESSANREWLSEVFDFCSRTRIAVELHCSVFYGVSGSEIDHCTGCFCVRERTRRTKYAERVCKNLLDRAIGVVGSLATLCLIPIIWVILKMEDGGPVFYRQEYVGADLQVHHYLKFRTMIQNADKLLNENAELKKRFAEKHKLEDDPRVLRCGRFLRKFSVDEFPEFFSVLTGSLSFVGPRTISVSEKERYDSLLGKLLSVKPGLTGYWQVMGRQTTSYDERVRMDMFYIDHRSIWLDLVIIAKTFSKFFAQEGAF